MATVPHLSEEDADPRVKAVLEEIKAVRGSDRLNNFWHYLAADPALLESTWAEVRRVMVQPSALDSLTKELIYVAVSIANGCGYCVHSHTAAARAKGMTAGQYADLLAVVGLAARTNHLATALQVPVDAAFDADRQDRT